MNKLCRCFVVFILVILIFGRLGNVLEANYDGNLAMHGFYQMENDTTDVMFYGSSHIYAGVNVVDLWDDYGITGYDLAGTMQTLWNSYYNMEETLKYQSPKIMLVDLYGALIEEEYYTSTNVIKNASSMRFSLNKIKNIWSSVPHEEFLSYLLSYPLTHDRYRDIQKGDYAETTMQVGGKWYKGFMPAFALTRYDELPELEAEPERKPPSEKNREYLEKMVNLADKHQIQLAFIVVPYEGWDEKDEAVYSWIEDFAMENEVLFLNGNRKLAEMGFDPAQDYAEASHLNYSGACKFTRYLGEWIKSNCNLQDHRGEELYASWQEYSDCWASYRRDLDLKQLSDIESYINALEDRGEYIILVSVDDKYKKNPYVGMLEQLSGISLYDFENGGTVVIEVGALVYRTPDEPEYLWYMETDSMDIAVVRNYGEPMKVWVNNVEQNNNYNDVTILVYNRKLDMIADVVAFNGDGAIIR